ncbi:flagellar hook protein FlgE [Vreelandella titanicae]|uniref:flagellar hook protein FlgE n=1 Tax=Vreelandella titanicae TaxID=664683 RepID=UPI0039BFB28D
MSFSQALSGLNAQQQKLGATGNNIANSQTVGFKNSDVLFADVYAGARGIGVSVAGERQDFTQGSIEATNRDLDLAISGEGFYRLEQSTGEIGYSRNGQMSLTADGYIVNAQGDRLMGYGLDENVTEDTDDQLAFPFSDVLTGTDPIALQVYPDNMPAKETSEINAVYNFDSTVDHTDPDQLESKDIDGDGTDDIDYHFSSTYTVYDSLGTARSITTYFEKTGDGAWNATAYMDGDAALGTSTFNLTFDASGRITGPGTEADDFETTLAFTPPDGAEPMNVALKLRGTTQFDSNSIQTSIDQDGFATGALVGITVQEDGTVMRNFSNEQSSAAGQIVLANFRNVEGLQPLGNNLWGVTNASGSENYGTAGTGLFGKIESGAVEASNVDLPKELVDMIVAQRAYQANSTTISTQDELLQTIINL